MNLSETLYPAEAAEDTVEALFHEQGRDRPVLFWLTALVLGAAIASLPLVKVDLSVGARGIVRLSNEDLAALPGAAAAAGSTLPVTIDAFLDERDAAFLKVGQPVTLRYDAFPYIAWGTAPGMVVGIPIRTVAFGNGARCRFTVQSPTTELRLADGRTGPISDGMTVGVQVVVNRKSLLDLIYQRSEELFGI
jgi:hypothetical protein